MRDVVRMVVDSGAHGDVHAFDVARLVLMTSVRARASWSPWSVLLRQTTEPENQLKGPRVRSTVVSVLGVSSVPWSLLPCHSMGHAHAVTSGA